MKLGVFHLRQRPYARFPLFIENQWVLGVVGLSVDECLDVGPQITV